MRWQADNLDIIDIPMNTNQVGGAKKLAAETWKKLISNVTSSYGPYGAPAGAMRLNRAAVSYLISDERGRGCRVSL